MQAQPEAPVHEAAWTAHRAEPTTQWHRRGDVGRRATHAVLPRVKAALADVPQPTERHDAEMSLHIDPVCRMTVSSGRARGRVERDGVTYYFCSTNCRDAFERYGDRYRTPPRNDR